jgi:CHAD domain-containing protein
MRIDCKKLRYLLEFFRSLYPPADVTEVVQALKRLQDNLGEINDLRVQQASLTELAGQMLAEGTASAETLIAMGRLAERLEARRAAESSRFEECFAGFATRENHQRVTRGLSPTGGGPA